MVAIRRLVWDPRNVAHIAQHGVTREQVEEACAGRHIDRLAYGGRIMLIGATVGGAVIAMVLEPLGDDLYYPVTARPASRRERQAYQNETESE